MVYIYADISSWQQAKKTISNKIQIKNNEYIVVPYEVAQRTISIITKS